MTPRHLTHDAQASAVAAWGRGGSFRCVACGEERTDAVPALAVPTSFPGFALAACGACARRLRQSAGYRRQTAENARIAGERVVCQRAADLVGVSGSALTEALHSVATRHEYTAESYRLVDSMLGVPAGSVEGAMNSVLKCGGQQ
jgi:hypothetical protein